MIRLIFKVAAFEIYQDPEQADNQKKKKSAKNIVSVTLSAVLCLMFNVYLMKWKDA